MADSDKNVKKTKGQPSKINKGSTKKSTEKYDNDQKKNKDDN